MADAEMAFYRAIGSSSKSQADRKGSPNKSLKKYTYVRPGRGLDMALAAGKQLGPYHIETAVGAGGMGEVYRAHDTRLGRTVAIKVLPEGEYAGEEARRRFQREARVISGLSHPHICTIHDIGDEHGLQFIVMEYLEGETLGERLKRGALPAVQVLQYGIEIADALEKAHRARIIHRDLKPGNIMLTKSGIKLLDFGLARIVRGDSAPLMSGLTALPTEDTNITGAGAILGTLQYMAPEQLEGRESDARTDIFAFGAVLYEMVTGQRAFRGQSQASLIAAILSSEPATIIQLSPMSPPALDRVVRICLRKEPDERWQTAHDVRLQLEWIRDAGSQAGVPPVKVRHRVTRERAAWTVAALAVLLAALLAIFYVRQSPSPSREIRFTIDSDPDRTLTLLTAIALSPDGQQLAYGALDSTGKPALWLRRLDMFNVVRLEGSEGIAADGVSFLAWSQDSRSILAQTGGKLLRFSSAGGATETLCPLSGYPSSINRSGVILISKANSIARMSVGECTPIPVAQEAAAKYDYGLSWPQFLPDGKHFLVTAKRGNKRHDILLGALDSAQAELLIQDGSHPKFLESGFVLFSRHGYLMAQAFDPRHFRVTGEPFLAIKNKMQFADLGGWADFDVAPNGVIAWKEQYEPPTAVRWFSRSGQVQDVVTESGLVELPRLSSDNRILLVSRQNPRTHTSDAWSLDLQHGGWRRQTFRDAPGGTDCTWSADGQRFIYSSLTGRDAEMYLKFIGDTSEGTLLQTGVSGSKTIADWSRDGKSIVWLLNSSDGTVKDGIYGQSLAPPGKPFLLAENKVEDDLPRFSPDGHWIAFVDDSAGKREVHVRRFTNEATASVQVSSAGGNKPRWSRDGRQIFYRNDEWKLMAVPVSGSDELRFGKPQMVLQLPPNAEYEVSSDNRFLVSAPTGRLISPIMVVVNWRAKPE